MRYMPAQFPCDEGHIPSGGFKGKFLLEISQFRCHHESSYSPQKLCSTAFPLRDRGSFASGHYVQEPEPPADDRCPTDLNEW